MAQVIKLKRTAVQGKIPTTSQIDLGELAINTYDGRIFFEKDNGTTSIQEILTSNSDSTGSFTLGDLSASSFISASSLNISGNATIQGNLTLGGNITIGDSTTDSISVSADFSSSLIPDSGSTYDLGSVSKPWNEVHANTLYGDGSNITNITVDAAATVSYTFTNESTITVSHNFNTRNILVAVYDNQNNQVLPQNVNTSNLDQAVITLSSAQSGVVVVAKGGHILSGSADDSNKLGGKLPSAYATTGSNQFQDNQEITGSLNVSGGITGSISATNGIISGSSQVTSSLLNQDVNLGTGDLTGSNLSISSTGSFGRVEATSIDLDRLSLTSTQTTVPPLQLTANSLQDGVGALRIDGSQADIFLNPSTATHTTVTFAVNDDQRLAFGMDNNSDFYITRRTGGTWYDDTLVLDRETGQVSLGYDLSVSGDATIVGNLTVQGTTTTINTSTFNVEDNIIELNYGGSATEGGIFVKDSTGGSTTSGSLLWDATNDYWKAGTSGSESEIITTSNIVTNLPTGTISGSEQLPSGTVSGSTQITNGSGLLSSSNEDFSTFSSSVDNRLDQLETDSGSQDGRLDNLELFTSSLSTTESTYSGSFSGSFVGDGSGITGLQVDQVATVTASFSNQSTINVSHNFGTYNVIVSTYDSNYNQLIPQTVSLTDTNTVQVVLSGTNSGHVVVAKGGHVVSGSTSAANISGLSQEIQTLTSYREDVSGASFYNVTHSLDESYPFVQAWNTSNNTMEQPLDIESVNSNVITVSFAGTFAGKIIVKK